MLINICGNSPMLTDSLCSLSLCRLFLIINFLTLKREHKRKHGHKHEHKHKHEYAVIESIASIVDLCRLLIRTCYLHITNIHRYHYHRYRSMRLIIITVRSVYQRPSLPSVHPVSSFLFSIPRHAIADHST